MIYYTADLHLGHQNIITHCCRPFSDADEMDETIISNWNSVVTDKDDVYIVGDISFKIGSCDGVSKIKRLKGKKHLIIGNHDVGNLKKEEFAGCFVSVDNYLEIKDNGRRVVLFHYPIAEWNGYFRGAYHVYGHIHNNEVMCKGFMDSLENAFNAGTDLHGFFPVTLDRMIEERAILCLRADNIPCLRS